jgi:hypothetical protein
MGSCPAPGRGRRRRRTITMGVRMRIKRTSRGSVKEDGVAARGCGGSLR